MRILLVLALALPFYAQAQVYKWVDDNGVTHFGAQPPPGENNQVDAKEGYQPSGTSGTGESSIMRQARQLELRKQKEAQQRRRQQALEDRRQRIDNRPDYICTGAKNRADSAKERWRQKKMQGFTLSEKRRYGQRIRKAELHRDNVCR